MKKSLFTFFALLATVIVFSQNWSPINLTEKFHYQNDTSIHITNTVYVDSFHVEGMDSIFHLNRIVLPCDTCTNLFGFDYYLANQGQFLQKNVRKETGDKFSFLGKNPFALLPIADLNESWLMDTLNNIEATISNIQTMQLFDNQDSVKTISLSTGDSILLSKNHGITYFPDIYDGQSFLLVGIEGRDLGELVPDFWEIYDFQIGDILQYEGSYSEEAWDKTEYLEKLTITEKEINGSTITYQTLASRCIYKWNGYSNCNMNFDKTLSFEQSNHHMADGYNHELSSTNTSYGFALATVQFKIDEEGDFVKAHEVPGHLWNSKLLQMTSDTSDLLFSTGVVAYQLEVKAGLGTSHYGFRPFEGHDYRKLIGYVRDGDTTGIVLPDSTFVVSTNQQFQSEYSLQPNPTDGEIQLNFKQNLPHQVNLYLYNSLGQLLLKKTIAKGSSKTEMDLADYTKGVYYLVIEGKETHFSEKIILW